MISEIKNIISPDVMDFDNYWPVDEDNFSFLVSVRVGPKGENTEESFDVAVCSPKWILENYGEDEIILGKNKIIVFKYNKERLFSRLRKLFDGCSGNDWQELAIKLSRIGLWEFENYQK